MKKKHKNKGKHRNAGPPRPAAPRASPRKPADAPGMGVGEVGALIVASAATAGLGALAQRASPTAGNLAAVAFGTASAIGALKSDGVMRAVSAGVLSACAGHGAVQLIPKPKPSAPRVDKDDPPPERRQAALPPPSEPDLAPSLREELARAHAAVAALYPDDYDAHRVAA